MILKRMVRANFLLANDISLWWRPRVGLSKDKFVAKCTGAGVCGQAVACIRDPTQLLRASAHPSGPTWAKQHLSTLHMFNVQCFSFSIFVSKSLVRLGPLGSMNITHASAIALGFPQTNWTRPPTPNIPSNDSSRREDFWANACRESAYCCWNLCWRDVSSCFLTWKRVRRQPEVLCVKHSFLEPSENQTVL